MVIEIRRQKSRNTLRIDEDDMNCESIKKAAQRPLVFVLFNVKF
tara:strand:+ start:228 stop:359 length:132 start_codon:yes stop_codon:yes gene_type:complete